MIYITKSDTKMVTDESFTKYGRVLDYDFIEAIEYLEKNTVVPEEGNQYVASDSYFEKIDSYDEIIKNFYGNQDIQFGYCNGKNNRLNALEYHSSNEINIAATDMVLLLGDIRDIENEKYDTKNVEAFYVNKGQAIEMYTTTLHFSPIRVDDKGFKCAVLLPRYTNNDIEHDGNDLLFKNNKWILTHPDNRKLIEAGVKGRLVGENIEYREG